MTPSHAQYNTAVAAKLQGWLRRQSRRLPAAWQEAAFAPPCASTSTPPPLLRALYAPSARGRPPYDPVCVLNLSHVTSTQPSFEPRSSGAAGSDMAALIASDNFSEVSTAYWYTPCGPTYPRGVGLA